VLASKRISAYEKAGYLMSQVPHCAILPNKRQIRGSDTTVALQSMQHTNTPSPYLMNAAAALTDTLLPLQRYAAVCRYVSPTLENCLLGIHVKYLN
jgi:hypothetical protein